MKAVTHDHEHHHATDDGNNKHDIANVAMPRIHRSALSAPAGGQSIDPAPVGGSGFYDAINAGLVVMRSGGGEIDHMATTLVSRAAQTSGHSLPGDLRAGFEQSLGTDLGGVRVHTDGAAAAASDALGARAYAVGQDVYMGAGQYNPSSPDGQFLLAHEVAHTVQQRGAASGPQCKLEVSEPGDALESDADSAATAMVLGKSASVASAGVGAARKIMRFGNGEYQNVRQVPFGDSLMMARSSRIGFNGYLERFDAGNPRPVQMSYAPVGQAQTLNVQYGVSGAFRVRLVVGYEIARRADFSEDGSAVVTSSIRYNFRPDGTLEFTSEYGGDVPHLISGSFPEGLFVTQNVTAPSAGAAGGTHQAGFAFVFQGGSRTGATATATTPDMRMGSASVTTGQHTPPAHPETAHFPVIVNVIGAPAPAAQAPEGQGGGGSNNNTNTVSPNINAHGGAGGNGTGGNATGGNATGGNASAQGGSSNVTINMPGPQQPGPQPGPQPTPQARTPSPGATGLEDINFDVGSAEPSPGGREAMAAFVRRVGRDPQLVEDLRNHRLRLHVHGYASRTERTQGRNQPLSQQRAEAVASALTRYFSRELDLEIQRGTVQGEGAAGAEERGHRYENEEQRAEWRLAP